MKKLGLIGGMGPESTIPYYRDILYGVQKRLGKDQIPEMAMESIDVFKLLRLCKEEKLDEVTEYLLKAIQHVAACGADFAALSSNTSHIVFDRLQKLSPIPLLSILEASCVEAQNREYSKIGVMGTIFSMKGEFFSKPFQDRGIAIIRPSEPEMVYLNDRISTELEHGIVKQETLKELQKIIHRMKDENGIQAVVLGCTELPLILNDSVSLVPCLDTMKIHINAIIDEILKD